MVNLDELAESSERFDDRTVYEFSDDWENGEIYGLADEVGAAVSGEKSSHENGESYYFISVTD